MPIFDLKILIYGPGKKPQIINISSPDRSPKAQKCHMSMLHLHLDAQQTSRTQHDPNGTPDTLHLQTRSAHSFPRSRLMAMPPCQSVRTNPWDRLSFFPFLLHPTSISREALVVRPLTRIQIPTISHPLHSTLILVETVLIPCFQ